MLALGELVNEWILDVQIGGLKESLIDSELPATEGSATIFNYVK
jgi:hypothetical protein